MPKPDKTFDDPTTPPTPDDETTGLGDLTDSAPDWLKPADDLTADQINSLIEDARESVAALPPVGTDEQAAADALAEWSTRYGDPKRELADLYRLRNGLKVMTKGQLKAGQFAAVKGRIAVLEKLLGV